MATIIDPSGSVSVVYRDPSVTAEFVNAAGTVAGTATLLTIRSETNIAFVTTSASNTGVKLPNAEVGDRFEIYKVAGTPGLDVYDFSGNNIGGGGQMRFNGTTWNA